MSQYALCSAAKSILQSGLSLGDETVDIGFDGEPNPVCGQEFIRVWPADWSGIDVEGLAETFGFNVTLTHRVAFAPRDRPPWSSLESRLRQIIALLHLDVAGDALIRAANTIISATIPATASGFVTPPRFRTGGRPEPKGPDWFGAQDVEGSSSDYANAGVAQTLTFSGAERYQHIESMT